jgi:hypothetical protein
VEGWILGVPGFIRAGKERVEGARGLAFVEGQFCRFGKLWRNCHICGEFLSR